MLKFHIVSLILENSEHQFMTFKVKTNSQLDFKGKPQEKKATRFLYS